MLLQNAAKGWNSLGHLQSNLWATELNIHYSNVYGKISFDPLSILASVQEDLSSLAEWEEKWGMCFHPEKCSTL